MTEHTEEILDRSHPVVFVNNTVIYLFNNTNYIGNNIKNSAIFFGSVEPSSGQIQGTVLVHSASALAECIPVLYLVLDLMMFQPNRKMSPNFKYFNICGFEHQAL